MKDRQERASLPLLEVCVEGIDGARAAEAGGAARIELCADLKVGGLSPAPSLMRAVREAVSLPIVAMVRPRAGDFLVSEAELSQMTADIRAARDCGVDAVVFGALLEDGRLDERSLERLVKEAAELPSVFHRAFDQTPNGPDALEALVGLGFERLLCSGHANDAQAGAEELAELVRLGGERLTVMPGGGVRADHAWELRRRTGATEFHSSVWGFATPSSDAVRELFRALQSVS